MTYINTGLKISPPIHDRPAIEMNKCLEETGILDWTTKRKSILIQKKKKTKKYRPRATTDRSRAYDIENTNGIN